MPLLNICGSLDFLLERHTLAIENRYQRAGRPDHRDDQGRHRPIIPHSLRNPKPIADWIEQHVQPTGGSRPDFADETFTKSYYYGLESSYRHLQEEKTYATCRGPGFTECYDRYDARTESPWGITGHGGHRAEDGGSRESPGCSGRTAIGRDAVVDQALLAKGFHIVVAPLVAQAGPVRQQWDAVYKLLIDHGFSRKPVLEGAGTAAGEAYAWAIENPDKVSCIYGENPVLRSLMSKTPPLDHLAPLAKAGVPLIHVCGSLDPWLDDQTARRREAIQGTRRPDHGHRQGRRGTLSDRTEGPETGRGFHPGSPFVRSCLFGVSTSRAPSDGELGQFSTGQPPLCRRIDVGPVVFGAVAESIVAA